jgi:pimeloyl-ACP methyl ester carboxylesterase
MADSSKFFRIGVLAAALLAASLTIVLWSSSGAEPAAAASSTIKSKEFSVETKDGVTIHVSEKVRSGGTKKVPILLVHSLWTNSQTWDFPGRSVMNYLATNGYDVYALDLRGMGESERPLDDDYNTIGLLDRVKDLEAVASFIKERHKRPPVVLGYSQGGALTGVLAASRPKLVSGVGLFSVPANGFFVPDAFDPLVAYLIGSGEDHFLPSREQLYALDFRVDPVTGLPWVDPVTGLPTISNEAFETHYSMSEEDSVRAILELASPEGYDPDNDGVPFYEKYITPSWSQIKAPALVVDGAQDLTVGEERARALYDALGSENKDLIIFNQNAHAWFLEDNYQATQSQAFDEFLAQFDQ